MALGSIAASGAASWARNMEDRGVQNERRISALEVSFASMNSKLDAASEKQKEILRLVQIHMNGGK
jgi:hypothetical protein